MSDAPFFSRSGNTNPLGGTLDAEIKIKVTADMQDDFRRAAAEAGLNASEFGRELVMIALYGADYLESLYRERTQRIAKFMTKTGNK